MIQIIMIKISNLQVTEWVLNLNSTSFTCQSLVSFSLTSLNQCMRTYTCIYSIYTTCKCLQYIICVLVRALRLQPRLRGSGLDGCWVTSFWSSKHTNEYEEPQSGSGSPGTEPLTHMEAEQSGCCVHPAKK